MKTKKLIPAVWLSGNDGQASASGNQLLKAVQALEGCGADEILVWDGRPPFDGREERLIRELTSLSAVTDTPLLVYQEYARFEDIKKIIYAGAARVVMNPLEGGGRETLKEGVARFGAENVMGTLLNVPEEELPSANALMEFMDKTGCLCWLLDASSLERYGSAIAEKGGEVIAFIENAAPEKAAFLEVLDGGAAGAAWKAAQIGQPAEDSFAGRTAAAAGSAAKTPAVADIRALKEALRAEGIPTELFESAMPFSAFKLNGDGLIPVVVQDYKTGKVLMLAYMNEEAYAETIRSGRMTYYSRSRQCLWKKGDTSGHYQFVKSLDIDCDCDTILAKVKQIGAACHTGNESCFFTPLAKKEYDDVNPATILQEIMATVQDRKAHPKEGSYTNYLFDKGIDKILKKVGEEATEIVIAAKNPDASELKYEISDFLYHMIVLMAERGVTWEEISAELAKRH